MEVSMKRFLAMILLLSAASGLFAIQAGVTRAADPSRPQAASGAKSQKFALAYLDAEIRDGRFVLKATQRDTLSPVEHLRYQQLASGLPVWGGEIVVHMRNGKAESCDGEYYVLPAPIDPAPKLSRIQALQAAEGGLKQTGLEVDAERSGLVIYPVSDTEFRLAYKLWVRKPDAPMFNETALVDAATGAILLHFSNIKNEDLTIGVGLGQRGDTLKFPTTLQTNLYYMWDKISARPFTQRTFDGKHQYGATISISSTSNNSWASDNIVNIHTYIGYTYDLFYTMFGLKGPNNANMPLTSFAHIYSTSQGLTDNAFWNEDSSMYGQGMYFLDAYKGNKDYGAALDVVAHELSHAVTTFHANLTYFGESGALNESFSDVIGTATEWRFQAPGTGYNLADWVNAEDAGPTFSYDKCRRQDNPNLNSQLKNAGYPAPYSTWPDPAHILQKIPTLYSGGTPIDSDNVHLNCTIFPHAFYLLANGGANPYSGKTVAKIGLEAATKIFYDAFINRMTSSTNFLGAANALLASAYYLYGASSSEYAQTKEAIRAIGYTVN
jgi:bacillolysin